MLVYKFYLAHNKEISEKEKRFVSGFLKVVKSIFHKILKFHGLKKSAVIKQNLMNADRAFRNFFNHKANELEEKIKDVKMYFVRNGVKQPVLCERHKIKIPTLGWVRLKEKGSDQSGNT